MKRIYHHCDVLEEAPMWDGSANCDELSEYAANLMREPDVFEEAMREALKEWGFSCEHNLSAKCINRRAWLGHAGCYIAVKSPEHCTRKGWRMLTIEEQAKANKTADKIIKEWEDAKNFIGY